MKVDIWMPIYLGDYLKDTRHLSTIEHGAYLLLLMELWDKGGKIPTKNLNRICLVSEEKWPEIWDNLKGFFTINNGSIRQKRLSLELEKCKKRRKSAQINGLQGGRPPKPKPNPEETQKKPIGKPKHNPNPNPQKSSSSSSSSSSSKTESTLPREQLNAVWNQILFLFQIKPANESERKRIGRVTKELVQKEATPETVELVYGRFKQEWPKMACTPEAILKHYDYFMKRKVTVSDSCL